MMDSRIAELVKAMKGGGGSSGGGGGGCAVVDCQWKREYQQLAQEYEMFQQRIRLETEAELNAVENKLTQMRNEAEVLKRTLETENRDLLRQKTVLERENKALREDLNESRTLYQEQLSHHSNLKKQLEIKCSGLEQKLEDREKELVELRMQFNESNSRNDRLEKEFKQLSEQNERLHVATIEMKRQYEDDLHKVLTASEEQLDKVDSYFREQLEKAGVEFLGVSSELTKGKEVIARLLEHHESREEEFRTTATTMQKMIRKKLQETQEALANMELERGQALLQKRDLEDILSKTHAAVTDLNNFSMKHHTDVELICSKTIAIFGTIDNQSELHLISTGICGNEDGTSAKVLDMSGSPDKALRIIERLKQEEASLKLLIKTVSQWKQKTDQQQAQFRERIDELEKTSSMEKMKHLHEITATAEKLKVYKKLVIKLRKRLDASLQGSKHTETLAYPTTKPSTYHSHKVPSHDGGVAAGMRCPDKQSSSDSPTSSSLPRKSLSAKFNSKEFKVMLSRAEHLLKRIEDTQATVKVDTPRSSSPNSQEL